MDNQFFERPILNSPYEEPTEHWELDQQGQPTQRLIHARRPAQFITPIPKPRKRKTAQQDLLLDEGEGISTERQQYATTSTINELRFQVEKWRKTPNANDWHVTPETARLLQHWRHHKFSGIRPFFCQVEAVETAIWLTEVAPKIGKTGERFLAHLANANQDANPDLMRLALKLATGAGKTTVMAMVIAWQTINAVRRPGSTKFTRGFLVVSPGLTIRDRLRSSAAAERSGRLLRQPGTGPRRYVGRSGPRQDRDHELPRLQTSGANGAFERHSRVAARPWRGIDHSGNGRPDDPACDARASDPPECLIRNALRDFVYG
jgi:hypothetical protein